jgi:chromosome segregation ATPase
VEQIISLFVDDPMKAIAVCSVFLASFLAVALYKRLKKDFQGFESKMDRYETAIEHHATETKKALATHSENMGRATKAINGDMLKIKESVFELKRELVLKLDEARAHVAHLERQTLAMSQALLLTTEKFDEKFGRIIEFKKEIETLHGKVLRLEESSGSIRIDIVKHTEWFGQIAKTLKAQKAELDELRPMRKKGPNEV